MASIRTIDAGATHADGVKIAETGEKLGLLGATPVVRPASANQTALTDNTGGAVTDAILADGKTAAAPAAITAANPGAVTDYAAVTNMTDPVTKAEGEAVSAALALLADEVIAIRAEVVKLVTDLTATRAEVVKLVTDIGTQNDNDAKIAELLNALRTAGVDLGAWKGAA